MLLGAWFLIAAALAGSDPEAIDVRLELARDGAGRPTLTVHAEYPSTLGDVDLVSVSTRGAGEDASDVRHLAACDSEGNGLTVEARGPGQWAVRHPLGARYRVETRLEATPGRKAYVPGEYARAVLEERMLYTSASWVLALPQRLERRQIRPVRIEWVGSEALGWEVASSFGAGPGPFELGLSLEDLSRSLLLAGEFELFEYEVPDGDLLVAVAGDTWGSDRIEFAQLARDVIAFERSYLGDTMQPFHLVSLIPRAPAQAQYSGQWGIALHRASALFSTPGVAFGGASGLRGVFAGLLLHESYHGWDPDLRDVTNRDRPDWFFEGFAEFFALRLALRGGFIELDDYVESLNRTFALYAHSSARSADSPSVPQEFWSEALVRRQPYLLGHLIAARVDAAIRARSGGERSLDDLMRELEREARAHADGRLDFGLEGLFARMEAWAGEALPDVRSSAISGTLFELPSETFAPVLELEFVELRHGMRVQRASLVPGQGPTALSCL
jgi:predicted metalloprotease with PDZ domain